MSRMLAALRHLEQQSGGSDNPLRSIAPAEAPPILADPVRDMAVLDAPPTVSTSVEFATSVGFAFSETAQAEFVANPYSADLPATAYMRSTASTISDASLSESPLSEASLSNSSFGGMPLKSTVEVPQPLPNHDPYDPYGLQQTSGPYPSDWSYRPDLPTVEVKRSPADGQASSATTKVPSSIPPQQLQAAQADETPMRYPFGSEDNESVSEAAAAYSGSEPPLIAAADPIGAPFSIVDTDAIIEPASIVELFSIAALISMAEPVSVADPVSIATQPAAEEALATISVPERTRVLEIALLTTSSVELKDSRRELKETTSAAKSADGSAPPTDPKRVKLPASDPEMSSHYRKLCGRLLATHPKARCQRVDRGNVRCADGERAE